MASFLARDDKVWHRTLTEQELRDRVAAVAGEHTDRVIETYRRLYPGANPAERLIATLTDSNFRIRSLIVAEHKARQAARAGLHVFVRMGDAGAGRAAEGAARARRAVHVRHDRSDQRDRPQRGRAQAGGDDVRHLGGIRACRRARQCCNPALAGV